MNRDIPEPRPYPFCSNSSRRVTINPAKTSCIIMSKPLKYPSSAGGPYIPEITYANASPTVINKVNNFEVF